MKKLSERKTKQQTICNVQILTIDEVYHMKKDGPSLYFTIDIKHANVDMLTTQYQCASGINDWYIRRCITIETLFIDAENPSTTAAIATDRLYIYYVQPLIVIIASICLIGLFCWLIFFRRLFFPPFCCCCISSFQLGNFQSIAFKPSPLMRRQTSKNNSFHL